nr:2-amino-4-hydroxy-6-hydroxymethyldihydropteridine diphosphokinase [uncultured Carboxylicivirga sp.]
MKKENNIILLLGGNIGDTQNYFKDAISLLSTRLGSPIKISYCYESEPWGFEASQNFINQVVEFSSFIEPLELLDFTQQTEKKLGRKEKAGNHYESRPIDIDILFIDNLCLESERLTIPHSLLHKRRFTLLPLSDYWNDLIHPKLQQTVDKLLSDCKDGSNVKRID